MKLNVKYFGMLSEVTTCNEEDITFNGGTIADLLELLFNRYPSLKGKTFRVAQNNTLSPNECEISANKIALLPSFAGG